MNSAAQAKNKVCIKWWSFFLISTIAWYTCITVIPTQFTYLYCLGHGDRQLIYLN